MNEQINVIVFGTGTNAKDFMDCFVNNSQYNINVTAFFDNNKSLAGEKI